jgi:hypothetical protein
MRTFALLVRYGVSDRSGDEKFYEVYPAGSLSQRGLTSRRRTSPIKNKREKTSYAACVRRCRWLIVPDTCATTGDGLDALIASLTARAATQGRTLRATRRLQFRREEWVSR